MQNRTNLRYTLSASGFLPLSRKVVAAQQLLQSQDSDAPFTFEISGLGQPRQELVAAGIGRLHAQRHLPEAEFGEFLAVAQPVDIDRRGKEYHCLGLSQA